MDFQIRKFMLNFFKKTIKKSNIQDACEILKIINKAISSHIISFRFADTSE